MKRLSSFFFIFLVFSPLYSTTILERHFRGIPYKLVKQYEGDSCYESYWDNQLDTVTPFLPFLPYMVEVGSRHGEETTLLAEMWPCAQIAAFEPNPKAFEQLKENTALYYNVRTYPYAVNTSELFSLFYLAQGKHRDESESSLLQPAAYMQKDFQGEQIFVECVQLEKWCLRNKVDRIDFLSLSAGGMELKILQGAASILTQTKVVYVDTYLQPFRVGMTNFEELENYMASIGFKMIAHWYYKDWKGHALFVR